MGQTIIEKILSSHASGPAKPGEIVDIRIDARLARDFGGANVVKNLRDHDLAVDDPGRTFFTFDCNPGGSDQKYAANQHLCRLFARGEGLPVYDVDAGIGTHIAIEEGLVMPGGTLLIRIADDWSIRMTGPAEEVATGIISGNLLRRLRS